MNSIAGIGSSEAAQGASQTEATQGSARFEDALAQEDLARLAEAGGSSLRLGLDQMGISLTDHSDVGPGERFRSHSEKMQVVMAMIMSMVSSQGAGPQQDPDVEKARSGAA